MKNIAVVFYSRTGKTRLAAHAIAETLEVQPLEITETADRQGVIGFVTGGISAALKKTSPLKNCPDITGASIVVIGTPVWASTMAPAVREWIDKTSVKGKEIVLFSTYGGSPGKALEQMEDMLVSRGAGVSASFSIRTGGVKNEQIHRQAVDSIKRLSDLIRNRCE